MNCDPFTHTTSSVTTRPNPTCDPRESVSNDTRNQLSSSLDGIRMETEGFQSDDRTRYALSRSTQELDVTGRATARSLRAGNAADVRGQLAALDEKLTHLTQQVDQHIAPREPDRARQILKSVVTVAAIAIVAAVAIGAVASPIGLVAGAVGLAYLISSQTDAANHADEAAHYFHATPWKKELDNLQRSMEDLNRRIEELGPGQIQHQPRPSLTSRAALPLYPPTALPQDISQRSPASVVTEQVAPAPSRRPSPPPAHRRQSEESHSTSPSKALGVAYKSSRTTDSVSTTSVNTSRSSTSSRHTNSRKKDDRSIEMVEFVRQAD